MIRSRFADAFSTVDYLLTPACAARVKMIGEEMIGDKSHRAVLSYFSAVVNHALLPALALPITGTGTPPASLQVIGPPDSESGLIGFGRWLEQDGIVSFAAPPAKFTYPWWWIDLDVQDIDRAVSHADQMASPARPYHQPRHQPFSQQQEVTQSGR